MLFSTYVAQYSLDFYVLGFVWCTQPPANEFMSGQLLDRYVIYCSLHNLPNTYSILCSLVHWVRAQPHLSWTNMQTQQPSDEFIHVQLLNRYMKYCCSHKLGNTDSIFTFLDAFKRRVHVFVLEEHTNAAAFRRIYTCTTTEQVCEILLLS